MRLKHQIQRLHLKIRLSNYLSTGLLITGIFIPFSHLYAALSCSVTTIGACSGTVILRMSGSTNAHSELPSQSNNNYDNNVVCCTNSPSSIGNSCSGNFQIAAKISGVTNGMIQESTINTYPNNVCLSDETGNDTVTVGYQDTNCTGYDTTLLSISASDNAHAGDGSTYTRKICATIIPQTISFDLDTASDFGSGESSAPYEIPLGILTTASVTHSDSSSIRMIVAEGETNAVGGMVITVMNTNGANGLASTSVPADNINSATASMSAGNENYGLCVASSGLTGFTRAAAYATVCSLASGTNAIVGLTSTAANILNSGGAPVSGGHAEIIVNAAISSTTPAHNDYTDEIFFVATGTF